MTQSERWDVLRPLVKTVVSKIESGELEDGDKLPPLRQFAEDNQVPFRVAHAVFRELNKAGIAKSVRGYGTYVCKGAEKTAKQNTVSDEVHIILHHKPHVISYEVRSLISELQKHRFIPVVFISPPADDQRQELLHSLRERWLETPPAAIVTEAYSQYLDQLVLSCNLENTKVIAAFRHPDLLYPGWHSVQLDIAGAHYSAMRYLLDKGHRKIGIALKQCDAFEGGMNQAVLDKGMINNASRLRGVQNAILEFSLDNVVTEPVYFASAKYPELDNTLKTHDADERIVNETVQWLKDHGDITAIIGQKPFLWYVKVAAHLLKRSIPDDLDLVSIGGTDNYLSKAEYPHLDWNHEQIAREITDIAISDMAKLRNSTRNVLVRAEWVHLAGGE